MRCSQLVIRRLLPIFIATLVCEFGQGDDLAALRRALMGADADASPVSRAFGVRPGIAAFHHRAGEFMNHVRMAAAVPAALHKGQVLIVFNGLREFLNRFGKPMRVVGDFHSLWNLRLRSFGDVKDVRLVLNKRPFKTLFAAVNVDAFPVLPRHVVKEAPHVRRKIAVLDFDVAAFHSKPVAALSGDGVANRPAPKATDVFRLAVHKPQARADDVSGVVHGNHLLPIIGPSVHILRMRGGEILQIAEIASVVHFLNKEKLAAVHNGLRHHVFEAGFLDGSANLFAFLNRGGHRHGA